MKFNEVERKWPALKHRLKERFPELPEDELERTEGGRRQLLQLLEAEYGVTGPKAERDLDEVMKGEDYGGEG